MPPPSLPAEDQTARFWALYEPHHDAFVRYCQARAYGEYAPQDLVHESILRAHAGFDRLKKPAAFLYFLFGIARRVLQQQARRSAFKGTYREDSAQQLRDSKPSPEQALDTRLLYEALDRLPNAQQEALILYEICGYPIKDIQQIQQASASAVKARLARGRKRLSRLLSDPGSHAQPSSIPTIHPSILL